MRNGVPTMRVIGIVLVLLTVFVDHVSPTLFDGEGGGAEGGDPSVLRRQQPGAAKGKHHLIHQTGKKKKQKKGRKTSKSSKGSKSKSKKKKDKIRNKKGMGNERPATTPTATRPAESRPPINKPKGKRPAAKRPTADRPTANNPAEDTAVTKPAAAVPAEERLPSSPCFSVSTYDSIDNDIAKIKNGIRNDKERSHFLGGIVRLAAHDFMDFDRRSNTPMGPDGCLDFDHSSNDGLETLWCDECSLKQLYDEKYAHLSRADFWVASANAVIRQTSIDNALDLKEEFMWGRKDRDVCRGSGQRLPEAKGCNDVEDVFLTKMGLDWKDAVALMGAHTLGRGDRKFSGHEGTWVDSDKEAQVFDKQYYEELFVHSWRPRNMGGDKQDWTTGRGQGNDRMMLNTDMCLVFDIEEHTKRNVPCCTRTNVRYPDGQDHCIDREAARMRCPMYSQHEERREATEAVRDMLGGSVNSTNNAPFYIAFAKAWRKATTVGQRNLSPLKDSCLI